MAGEEIIRFDNMNFLQRYLKKRALKKNLKQLGRLLYLRYGKSKYYTKNQVDRTIKEGKINKDVTFAGYTFFVEPGLVDSVIRNDKSSFPEIEKVITEIAEIFKIPDAKFSIENFMDEIRPDLDFSGSGDSSSDDYGSSDSDSGSSSD